MRAVENILEMKLSTNGIVRGNKIIPISERLHGHFLKSLEEEKRK